MNLKTHMGKNIAGQISYEIWTKVYGKLCNQVWVRVHRNFVEELLGQVNDDIRKKN